MQESPYYKLSTQEQVWVLELTLDADIDSTTFGEFTDQLMERWSISQGSRCVIDLSGSEFFGSILLGFLMNLRQRFQRAGGRMAVVGISPRLLGSLRIAKLDRLLNVHANRREAMDRF